MQKKRTVNIRDVAEAAGVSTATVSYALREPPSPKISAARRKQIFEIFEKMQYVPNENTRRMFSRQANTVALLFPSHLSDSPIVDQNFAQCLLGAQSELAKCGKDLLLVEVTEEFIRNKRWKRLVGGKLVDGLLLWGVLDTDIYLKDILKEKIPAVTIQSVFGNALSVTSDDYTAMRLMTDQVIAAGHHKLAVIPASPTGFVAQESMRGFLDSMNAHQLEPLFTTEAYGYSYDSGAAGAKEILEKASGVSCIITLGCDVALGCYDYLTEKSIRVPEDISITGANPGPLNPHSRMQLTSWKIPSSKLGIEGARLLCRLIEDGSNLSSIRLPVDFCQGNTLQTLKNAK